MSPAQNQRSCGRETRQQRRGAGAGRGTACAAGAGAGEAGRGTDSGRSRGFGQPCALGSQSLDVVFPVLHGTFGEDGTIRDSSSWRDRLCRLGRAGLLGRHGQRRDEAALCQAKLPIVPHVTLLRTEWNARPKINRSGGAALRYPVFVKPANLGSSVASPRLTTARNWDRR